MPLRSISFLIYFFGSSTGAIIYPMVGVLCYLALYHVYPQTTWWGMKLEFLGLRYSFICGVCLMIGTALNLNRLRFGRHLLHPLECAFLVAYITVLLASVLGLSWVPKSAMLFDKMTKVFIFILMFTHIVVTRRKVWMLVMLYMLMALYLGHEARNAPVGAFANNRLNGIGGPDFRESAGLAIHLFALLPFVAVVLRQKSLILKITAIAAAGYAVNAILLCRARSAFVAGIIAGMFALWYSPRKHRRWIIGVLSLGLAGGIFLSDSFFRERMMTIFSSAEERDKSAQSRLIIWGGAWEMFQDYPMGVGLGRFEYEIGKYASELEKQFTSGRDAHNTYVLCACETGILGITAYLGTLALAWWTLGRTQKRVRQKLSDPDLYELIIFANRLALLVYMIAGCFVSRFYTEGMWIFLALPICIARAVENEIKDEAREEVVLQAELPDSGDKLKPRLATS